MSTRRKEIREALVDLLTGATDCGNRVYANRVRPLWQEELPAILITTKSEAVEIWAQSPMEYKRSLTVDVIIYAEADDLCDDTLDILGAQVEAKLYEDHTLEEICEDVILRSAELGIEKNGDNLLGALTLTYEIPYYTQPVNDAGNLEFLNRVDVEYDLGSPSTENPEDIITGLSGL